MGIKGYFLDGSTSRRANACLEVMKGTEDYAQITVFDNDQQPTVHPFNLANIKIEARLGNTPREIILGGQYLFISEDHAAVDELAQLVNKFHKGHSLLYSFESNMHLVVAGVVTCIVLAWLTFTVGIPKAANYIAFQMPEFVEQKLDSTLVLLDKTLFEPSELSAEEQSRIIALMQPYNNQYPELKPELKFRQGMGANAFALPSGEIVFTDDFVKLVETDDELRAVYFHEIGHLANKHLTRRALQGAMLSIAVVLITGDIEQFDMVVGIPALLMDLSYSREFEREADSFAFKLMQENNISLQSFADIMLRLEDEYRLIDDSEGDGNKEKGRYDWLKYLSTHPGTQERVTRAQSRIKE